ncbi:MAG: hypothetical protein P4L85_11635 [Paludisphaera borealis]|uniref:hypothetical protein n=1 Tax=Paludisphaera borealis TaxID=1387353 RepID=UPI00283FBB71|nr:hypothetical protein [Paludisphaera borealis]MDR3619992.1 hypothetical protein [Paludisphaera borealis]
MRRLALIVSAGVLLATSARVEAQAVVGGPAVGTYRVGDYFAAPGLYGTSYAYASYGIPRTYTSYSAAPWSSYSANYPSNGFLPGRYGVNLWRPGFVAPGYVYGSPTSGSIYQTFPVVSGTGLTPSQIAPPPSIGVYAPSLGPGIGLYGR